MTKGPDLQGVAPKVGFKLYNSDFLWILSAVLEILANIGGYWALF
jgi:hypothetical protein